jgi:hypothetical protein
MWNFRPRRTGIWTYPMHRVSHLVGTGNDAV